ncbi:MAG: geranylgeranyl reductase family protein [Melioribacteraceae bacterium]|nr:geranylgeranyl reductase family protein [Melioribacteraceae bacterium]MCF8354606.1 geranylgeranyl reductase family protein [Melioribacteraceae bacterium]MCF8396363.1 geranylgeranyl reductase family protein [Melioribacteraceae bacterium]MCF8420183.1 geranylgeranyl reductase family protein [Melioribacteraceae bacterium]
MKNDFEVIVIGSGPSGSVAAILLAKAGIDTLIIEREKLPRHKTCGGGLVNRARNYLPVNIQKVIHREYFEVSIFDHQNNSEFIVRDSLPIITMILREEFDNYLVRSAVENGAGIFDDCKVLDIEEEEKNVRVETEHGNYNAGFVIGADGVYGISSKVLGNRQNIKCLPAVEAEIETADSNYRTEIARFDLGFFDHGYGWTFPKRDHLSVGVIAYKSNQENLNKLFDEYAKKLSLNILKIHKHGFVIPFITKYGNISTKRILLTGDAAGFVDPLTGEGIGNAILSGKFAAQSIIEGELNVDSIQLSYRNKIKDDILIELKYSAFLAKLFYNHPAVRKFLLKKYGQQFSEIMTDVFAGNRKYSTLLKSPSNYLKLIKPLTGLTA